LKTQSESYCIGLRLKQEPL